MLTACKQTCLYPDKSFLRTKTPSTVQQLLFGLIWKLLVILQGCG